MAQTSESKKYGVIDVLCIPFVWTTPLIILSFLIFMSRRAYYERLLPVLYGSLLLFLFYMMLHLIISKRNQSFNLRDNRSILSFLCGTLIHYSLVFMLTLFVYDLLWPDQAFGSLIKFYEFFVILLFMLFEFPVLLVYYGSRMVGHPLSLDQSFRACVFFSIPLFYATSETGLLPLNTVFNTVDIVAFGYIIVGGVVSISIIYIKATFGSSDLMGWNILQWAYPRKPKEVDISDYQSISRTNDKQRK
jgi:hypothetical protein